MFEAIVNFFQFFSGNDVGRKEVNGVAQWPDQNPLFQAKLIDLIADGIQVIVLFIAGNFKGQSVMMGESIVFSSANTPTHDNAVRRGNQT